MRLPPMVMRVLFWIFFLGADLAHDACVGDVTVSINRDVMQVYGSEGVGTGHPGLQWVGHGAANALAQATEFIGIRFVPCFFVLGMVS